MISSREARASRSSRGSSSRPAAADDAEVGGLHQHQRAEGSGEAARLPTGDGAGGAVVVVAGLHRAAAARSTA